MGRGVIDSPHPAHAGGGVGTGVGDTAMQADGTGLGGQTYPSIADTFGPVPKATAKGNRIAKSNSVRFTKTSYYSTSVGFYPTFQLKSMSTKPNTNINAIPNDEPAAQNSASAVSPVRAFVLVDQRFSDNMLVELCPAASITVTLTQ